MGGYPAIKVVAFQTKKQREIAERNHNLNADIADGTGLVWFWDFSRVDLSTNVEKMERTKFARLGREIATFVVRPLHNKRSWNKIQNVTVRHKETHYWKR